MTMYNAKRHNERQIKMWNQIQKDRWEKSVPSGKYNETTHSEVSIIETPDTYGVIGKKYNTKPIGINDSSNALSKKIYYRTFVYKKKSTAQKKAKELKKIL